MHTLQKKFKKEIQEIVFCSNRLAFLGYVTSHGGNLSYKVDDNTILITPTKMHKRSITFDDILILDSNENILVNINNRKPTGEISMHLRIFDKRPDINAMVHAHPPIITGFSMTSTNLLERPFLPEPIFEAGPAISVEYAEPVSDKLAFEFDKVVHKSNIFLLRNHGAMALSPVGIERALDILEMVETTAISIITALKIGHINEIPKESIDDLDKIITKRSLKIPGDPRHIKKLRDLY